MEIIKNLNPRYQNNKSAENAFDKSRKLIKTLRIDLLLIKIIRFFYGRITNYLLINKQYVTNKLFTTNKYFTFRNNAHRYAIEKYNTTWRNERKVEIPIVKHYLQMYDGKNILEVGNVMSHYFPAKHYIVDKFETYKNVINEDILTYDPNVKFDLIVSISTIEHVGWDDTEQNPDKIIQVIDKLIKLKNKDGKILITAPLGYNPNLDNMLKENMLPFDEIYYLKRISEQGEWVKTEFNKNEVYTYGSPYPCANTIFIGFIE